MVKNATVAVILSQSVEGKKGTPDHSPAMVIRYYREKFTDEETGECTLSDAQILGLAAVEGMRRRMALAKDGARFAAGEAPEHVYLPRPTDGAVHASKLQAATIEARGAFAAMLWGAKAAKQIEAPAPAPKAKAPKAKGEKKAPSAAQIKAREAFAAKAKARAAAKAAPAPAPVKSAKGEARAAKVAAKAAKVGASLPVSRPDLTPDTITKPNPAPAVKAVTLANGQTFQIEDATGI